MSEFISAPASNSISLEWIEFDCRVYTGPENGYTEIVDLSASPDDRPGAVAALAYWREEGHWGFLFKGGHIGTVPDNRIRYIKARVDVPAKISADTEHDAASPKELIQSVQQNVHVAEDMPKRRGRPPKRQMDTPE